MADAIGLFGHFVIVYFIAINLSYLGLSALAWRNVIGHRRRRAYGGMEEALASPLTPPVSVIIPAYNEEAWIVEGVSSMLGLHYPEHEVIVVDDGSTDATLERLTEAFDLVPCHKALRESVPCQPVEATYASRRHPELSVVRKVNGGSKADASNCGVNAARYPYICIIDGDSVLDEDALLWLARPLINDPELVAATGGVVRIVNGCRISGGRVVEAKLARSRLATLQVVEYFRAFLVSRVGWSRLGSLLIISGAFGLFHRDTVEAAGGYSPDSLGEDFELVLRMHRHLCEQGRRYRIEFVPDPVCWTEVPEDFRSLAGQRRRWQFGLADTLWRHRKMMANPRYGAVGMLGLPFFFVFELLGPVVELTGYVVIPIAAALGALNFDVFVLFVLVALVLGVLQSLVALAIGEFSSHRHSSHREVARMALYSLADNLGYRQILALWRLRALVDFFTGRAVWGEIKRGGAAT